MNEKETSIENYVDVTCAIIKNSEGKVLIARRGPEKKFAGKWEFPGGRIETDESAEVCLMREIREELGMVIEIKTPILTWEHDYGGPNNKFRLFAFYCRYIEGDPQLTDHDELAWAEIDELPNFDLLEADKKLVETLLNA